MARPARVRMRSRKPCVFARRRLFGWNVRLLTEELPTQGPRHRNRVAGRNRAAGLRRPQAATTYGTGAAGPGSNRPRRLATLGGQGDTPSTDHRLPTGCGEPLAAVARRLLACAPPALPPPSRTAAHASRVRR